MQYTLFFIPFIRREMVKTDYVIVNPNKNVYIRLNENGYPETCVKQVAQKFEYSKARNILDNLPKSLKKFHFKVDVIPDVSQKKNIIESKDNKRDEYIPTENITQWIEKFGKCGDILSEAEEREKQLIKELSNSDKELLDILHIIEIGKPKDLYNGWKLYKRIRNNRKQRRNIKDEIMIVENVLQNIKNISCFHREQVQKAIDGLFNRKYTFRIIEEGEEENASM